MRVSTKLFNAQQVRGFQEIRSDMQGIQEKIASGKNINRASDDPVGAVNLSVAKEQKEVLTQFLKNTDLKLIESIKFQMKIYLLAKVKLSLW